MSIEHLMKVVVFDLDGTLIAESSWELLHEYFQADAKKVNQNRQEYFSGKIDYETWMEKDILLWDSPTLEDVQKGLSKFTLEPFAEEVVDHLRSDGVISCIVSSGIDILAEMVGKRLEIERNLIFANELTILNGNLRGICKVEPNNKDEICNQLSHALSVPLSEFAGVGDAAPDISLFRAVALKLTYNPKDELIAQAADYVLKDLRELLSYCI